MPRALPALAALLAAAACALPGGSPARSFSIDYKAGQTFTYQVHLTVNGKLTSSAGSLPVTSDQTVTDTVQVTSVAADGTATLNVQVRPLGSQAAQPQAYQVQVARSGRIISGGQDAVSRSAPTVPGSDQLTPLLPSGQVEQGARWSGTYTRPNPFGSGSITSSYTGSYLRDEKVGTYSTAVIETHLSGPLAFDIDLSKLVAGSGQPPPSNLPANAKVHYTGSLDVTADYWLDQAAEQVVKATQHGQYSLAYDLSSLPQGQGLGTGKIAFDGTIDSDLRRV